MKNRRRANHIAYLVDRGGNKVGWNAGLEELMANYFSELFTASDTEWSAIMYYQVISKVTANRLKHVLESIISNTQSAFIPGRMIIDNIMIAQEIMHFMKRKMKGKDGWMALKLDMSKAYDRVEWGFLEAVLNKMGFDNKWVQLIMSFVVSANYQIALAGRVF
ncbi:hypothetical protein AgCh_003788 [Apium graveolens]